jgi:hypothetical protein
MNTAIISFKHGSGDVVLDHGEIAVENGNIKYKNGENVIDNITFQTVDTNFGAVTTPITFISDSTGSGHSFYSTTIIPFVGTPTGIVIGNIVTAIAANAFQNVSTLTGELVIPLSVESIGVNAFSGTSIKRVYIASPASIIGANAFNFLTTAQLFVTQKHIASYGGVGATFQNCVISAWV